MMRRTLLWLVNFEPVFMPALSPSMETGTVVEWKKKIGELVKESDVFCTIQTDKAVVDYTNTFESGYLAKIYCGNGQSAPVAKTIAVMVSDAADVSKADEYTPEGEVPAAEAEAPTAAAVAAAPAAGGASSKAPEGVTCEPVFMPALSPSMETGTVVEWKKKIGELVKESDVFCTIQTDKAVVDYTNTFESGYLAKIYCGNGQSAPVAKTIAVMVSDAADVEKVANYYPEDAVGGPPASAADPSAAAAAAASARPAPSAASAKHYGGSLDAAVAASGPSVARIAAGLETSTLAGIAPSGKGGRFLKSDFSGQPGFDYNDTTPARAMQQKAAPAAAADEASKTAAKSAAPAAVSGDIYNVVLKPGPVYKSVSDTALLKKLMHTMHVPKPKLKKAAE
ncbi:dihydrolipoamide acetyltransferase precursorlike protein [Leishmania major strain Friedlin]|uniref:Dihydrolipoamide acetyltransferase n=1 Tax=Leishmania major TaxID=5664 RepID=Q4QCG0_LEIMA|nr:dihydrolipoamide acetyltransferase precursorlike protein [Leishmania major strain Friedlin]AAY51376.1 dihydrolipoamide acetyltransferase [Leishmania major]CAG9573337.1 dihydrolipoamide_acetyltransferase_precursorlike_protein [Leishmania major strain Friedlin]CAJ04084.1 dihydrolipoamide acetyltransferase precursorlike protein [Leishmania major strain Friedlin]|eukprot:XP_001682988.1 dihydrolipoamide acetyltransferase precursorlike protein [Leishmania major strain Friedlin]